MNSYKTEGIILARTNFGEADRIITFLTPGHGKIKAMVKGVRKSSSKMAGGIELFSISYLTAIKGKGEIDTLISTRLKVHFGNIVKDLGRTNFAYEFLKMIDKNTEAGADSTYFNLLSKSLESLNDGSIEPKLASLWFDMQLLKLTGHEPNLHSDVSGKKLADSSSYDFQAEGMHFVPKLASGGTYSAYDIKFLRLGFSAAGPKVLARVEGAQKLALAAQPLVQSMLKSFVRM